MKAAPSSLFPARCALLFVFGLCFGCTTGPKLLPEAVLADMSASQFTEMKQQMAVSNDPAYTERARRVGERVSQVVGEELPNAQWEYVVFEDDAVNAFAMPGGKIGVNTGLIDLVENDDELAAVMGHEVAHVLLEHGNQRMSAELIRQLGAVATAAASEHYDLSSDRQTQLLAAYGVATTVGGTLPFGRNHEYQADQEGLIIAAKAGYDPRAAITFWEKMAGQGGGQPMEFLSTHPSHGNRIARLTEMMPEALEFYRAGSIGKR